MLKQQVKKDRFLFFSATLLTKFCSYYSMNQKINSIISFLFYMTTTVLAQNPFLTEYKTPHHTAPFNLIKAEHYENAMLKGMEEENKIVEEIINNPEPATFENTIIPYTQPGQLLENVCTVFFNGSPSKLIASVL